MDVPHAFERSELIGQWAVTGCVLNRGVKMNTHGNYRREDFPHMEDAILQLNIHSPNPLHGSRMKDYEEEFLNVYQEIKHIIDEQQEAGDISLLHDGHCHPVIHMCRNLFRVRHEGDTIARRRSRRTAGLVDTWAVRPEFERDFEEAQQNFELNPMPVYHQDVPYPPVFLQSRLSESPTIRIQFELRKILVPTRRGGVNPSFTSWSGVITRLDFIQEETSS